MAVNTAARPPIAAAPARRRLVSTLLALLAFSALTSGAATLFVAAPVAETFARLGLPVALATLTGAWKLIGGLSLAAMAIEGLPPSPRPRREWTYAGFTFLFSGAIALHLAAGDGLVEVAPLLLLFTLVVVTRALEGTR